MKKHTHQQSKSPTNQQLKGMRGAECRVLILTTMLTQTTLNTRQTNISQNSGFFLSVCFLFFRLSTLSFSYTSKWEIPFTIPTGIRYKQKGQFSSFYILFNQFLQEGNILDWKANHSNMKQRAYSCTRRTYNFQQRTLKITTQIKFLFLTIFPFYLIREMKIKSFPLKTNYKKQLNEIQVKNCTHTGWMFL